MPLPDIMEKARSLVRSGESNRDRLPTFHAEADTETRELDLYGEIYSDAVSISSVSAALNDLGPGDIRVNINSPGGSVFEGFAIYNALREHKGRITTIANSLAASAASVIFAAGDTRMVATAGRVMIHRSRTMIWAWSTGPELIETATKLAELLTSLDNDIAKILAKESNLSITEALEAMDEETWYTADEALENGIATQEYNGETENHLVESKWIDRLNALNAPKELIRLYRVMPEETLAGCDLLSKLAVATKGSDGVESIQEKSSADIVRSILADRIVKDHRRDQFNA